MYYDLKVRYGLAEPVPHILKEVLYKGVNRIHPFFIAINKNQLYNYLRDTYDSGG